MKHYRLVVSLLLIAVLTGLCLWWSQPADSSAPHMAVAVDADTTPLGHLRIFGSGTQETP